ncbi:PREDICTED: uncharacterized protein LOC109462677 [Branchiostoma belcheri]|uniref:Uncharacterized protein LOC109462677 n=1 Tax=Branchiostoma belcheri TaxID=7741 RepID=A0A6P4Y7P8_BRABE|nr:PREDICTED: uncharacterized protein LOC109462677 [Branchiostoma belcheri]
MAGTKLSLFLFLVLVPVPSQAGPSCSELCEVKHDGYCKTSGVESVPLLRNYLPCAVCNTTGQADENQLGCLPSTLKKLQVAGHSDRSGKLKPLPGLAKLHTLLLGPGHILTAGRGAFSSVPNLLALSMTNNTIKAIGSWFEGSDKKLQKLQLSWNDIQEIERNALQPLKKLYYLSIRHNRLRVVEEWYFAGLRKLEILHLCHNNISHIAGKAFDQLPRLESLYMDHNKLSFLPERSFPAISRIRSLDLRGNPFRCTCALGRWGPVFERHEYTGPRCGFPQALSGRKVADVEMGRVLPCPSPVATAKASRQDHGATLECEVFWEKQPEIGWMDPGGRAVGEGESINPCGGKLTTRLEHECPTRQSPEGRKARPEDAPSLPYIGRSTSTLHMDPQAYRCWTGGSYRCVVQSTAGNVDLPLNKASVASEGGQRQEHTTMASVYITTTPAQESEKGAERITKPPDKKTKHDDTTLAAEKARWHTVMMTTIHTSTPVQQKGRVSERITKPPDKKTKHDDTTLAAEKARWHTVMMTTIHTSTPVQQKGRVSERITKPPDKKTKHDDTTLAAEKAQWHTVMTTVHTSKPVQQKSKVSGRITKPPDDTTLAAYTGREWYGAMVAIYTAIAFLALVLLYRATVAWRKRRERRQDQRHYLHGNAMGGMPPQNIQPPAATPSSVNPAPPRHTYAEIPDDAPIPPYAETTRLENPMYGADPPPPSNKSTASSQPQVLGTTPARGVPNPPPRSDKQANVSDSTYYPPGTKTAQAQKVPDPLPRTNGRGDSNASAAKPRGLSKATMTRQKPLVFDLHVYDLETIKEEDEEEEEEEEGPNLYMDLNGPPRDPNVSSQPAGLGKPKATATRHGNSSDTQGLEMDGEDDDKGPNIYLDLNGPPRKSDSEKTQAEVVPDPLPRIHTYINSSVPLAQPQASEKTQEEEVPDPLPRIHTYVNSSVPLAQPQASEMPQEEEVPDPLPRTNIYVNSNVSLAQPQES